MKRLLPVLLVMSALSISACGGGGGGGSSVDDGQDSSSGTGGETDSGGGTSSGTGGSNLNSDGTGAGGTVKPSTVSPSGSVTGGDQGGSSGDGGSSTDSNDERFITYFKSEDDFGFWACFTENSDNTLIMTLYNSEASGNFGIFAVDPEEEDDFFEITWDADSNKLVITDANNGTGTFSNYQFVDDFRWDAEFTTGDFRDQVACGLFNQDGEFLGDTETQDTGGGEDPSDPAERFLTYFNSETDFSLWGCFGQNVANQFAMALYENDEGDRFGVFGINDNDPFSITWDADESSLVVQDDSGGTATFSNYSFSTDTRWDAEITLGDYNDDVACALYDENGQIIE